MHELYLWFVLIPAIVFSNVDMTFADEFCRPFADAVKAGTGNIMCSYNRINGSWACQNSWAQNNLLKTELGFQVNTHSTLFFPFHLYSFVFLYENFASTKGFIVFSLCGL